MFCKNCGKELDDNSLFCVECGEKVTQEPKTSDSALTTEEVATRKNFSKKTKKIIKKVILGTIIAGIVGFTLFLGIVLVSLIVYGKVYLYDGYEFTQILSTISIILMLIGICGIIAKIIFALVFKVGKFPKTLIARILLIALAVGFLSFSIWGFVDCGVTNSHDDYDDTGSTGGSSYTSFYTIYAECNCSYPWAEVDSSYLRIDTNPYNLDNSTTYASEAISAIKSIHSKFGVPEYVYRNMIETRAIDGRQTWSGRVNISWTYHPDQGLEVMYTE